MDAASQRADRLTSLSIFLTVIVIAFVGLALEPTDVFLVVTLDLIGATFVLGPWMLAGLWAVSWFGLTRWSRRWQLLIGAGVGLGLAGLLVLVLGTLGLLQRPLWLALSAAAAVAGVIQWRRLTGIDLSRQSHEGDQRDKETADAPTRHEDPPAAHPYRGLWLLFAPLLFLWLSAAANPPGFVWTEEGFGYDVLAYHLGLPKEYVEAGHIHYTPHNVYGNFPAQVEMLYLLAMVVLGETVDAGTTCNMIHLVLGLLVVATAWTIGRDISPRAGVIAGVIAAACGWLFYLSGLAYVENGMLFFGLLSLGVLLRGLAEAQESGSANAQGNQGGIRLLVLAGLLSGFACGCKYTAVPMIAIPLGVAVVILVRENLSKRIVSLVIFGAAALLAFSPWLIKNVAYTGNPVFPLVNHWFNAEPAGWHAASTATWNAGHAAGENVDGLADRFALLWRHVFDDWRLGLTIWVFALLSLFRKRLTRVDLALWAMVVLQLSVWLFATHLYARFTVVLLIPLLVLAARTVTSALGSNPVVVPACAALVALAGLFSSYRFHQRENVAPGLHPAVIYEGQLSGYEYFQTINEELPADARILLIGDARPFYFQRDVDYFVVFNRQPFAAAVRDADSPAEAIHWLRKRGYTHVLVNWVEVRRLRATYGFPPEITEGCIAQLEEVGLRRIREYKLLDHDRRYVTLYAVPSL